MSHQYETCKACQTKHIVLRNGEMSIHSNAFGVKCDGSGDPLAHIKGREEAARRRELRDRQYAAFDRVQKERRERSEAERREWRAGRDAALRENEDRRFRAYVARQMGGPGSRTVYVVKGAHTVSGGLPTHGKRH